MLPVDIQYIAMLDNYTKLKEDWEIIKDVLNLDVSYVKLLEYELSLRKDYADECRDLSLRIRELENRINAIQVPKEKISSPEVSS